MSERKPTIAVVGAGPVGLTVAARLVRGSCARDLRVRVLDAAKPAAWDPEQIDLRVYALSRASQRILESLGVWSSIASKRVCAYRRMHVWEGSAPSASPSIDFDCADIGEPDLGHIVEDRLIRDELIEIVSSAAGAEITVDAAIESLRVTQDGVELGLARGETVRATLIVAADGGESAIRSMLDVPIVTRSYAQHALVTHVATEKPHAHVAYQRFLSGGPLAFLPLSDGRSSVVWSMPSERADALMDAAEEDFMAALQAASGGVLGRLGAAARRARFPLRMLHALRYCRDGVALAGDAAHCVHPLAGQGMNLGLLDAACLADEVERALRQGQHVGDLKVLRRYERRRKGQNLQMLAALDALDRLFRLPRWAAPLRALGMNGVDCTLPAKRALMRHAIQPTDPLSGDPLSGDPARR